VSLFFLAMSEPTDVTIDGVDHIPLTEVFVNNADRITIRQDDEKFGEQLVVLDVLRARAVILALESAIAHLKEQGRG
jgi:hypothetical protein